MKRRVWMKVTDDVYELPIAVADSAKELADKLGIKEQTIRSEIYRYRHGITKFCSYKKVEVDSDV